MYFSSDCDENIRLKYFYPGPHFSACVKTAPEYIKALTEMQIQGWKVRNAIVETSQNYHLASAFEIHQYPTLLFYR